jgi:hypothetical protein
MEQAPITVRFVEGVAAQAPQRGSTCSHCGRGFEAGAAGAVGYLRFERDGAVVCPACAMALDPLAERRAMRVIMARATAHHRAGGDESPPGR